jgi:hypothetical protein
LIQELLANHRREPFTVEILILAKTARTLMDELKSSISQYLDELDKYTKDSDKTLKGITNEINKLSFTVNGLVNK